MGGWSIVHNLEVLWLPCMIIRPLYIMYNLVLSKYAWQPWSHSWPMDRRDPEANSGKMCAVFASGGREGMSS